MDSGAPTSTGASTPVSVKIKRIECKGKVDQGASGRQIQPTLRSFMDLKSGLVGVRSRPEQTSGKHTRAGWDPSDVPPGGSSKLLGEAAVRKESGRGRNQENNAGDTSREARPEPQAQRITRSGTRP